MGRRACIDKVNVLIRSYWSYLYRKDLITTIIGRDVEVKCVMAKVIVSGSVYECACL